MSGHKKRRGGGHGGEFHMDERWMTSYADMVTVLMCLFIVLYAMSSVDQAKFEKLANSLATGFGQTASQTVDTAEGVVVPADLVDDQGEGFTALQLAQQQVQQLADIKEDISQALTSSGVAADAAAVIDADGLTIGLVGEDTFFDGNSARLKAEAQDVLRAIAPVLAPLTNQVTVEGHADPHGSPAPFATDWELSAARSTAVLRFLVEDGGVQGARISSVSYGSTRPNDKLPAQSGQENRRVDIVIHPTSDADVSALIPEVVAGGTGEHASSGSDTAAKAEESDAPAKKEDEKSGTHTETASTGGH